MVALPDVGLVKFFGLRADMILPPEKIVHALCLSLISAKLTQRPSNDEIIGPRASRPPQATGSLWKRLNLSTRDLAFDESGRDARGPSDGGPKRSGRGKRLEQFAFDFSPAQTTTRAAEPGSVSVEDQVRIAAFDYQLQMQAYALAIRELISPNLNQKSAVISTLHFLDPNVEFHLPAELLAPEACRSAIDEAMSQIASSSEPQEFPVHPALHCRMCNFLGICNAGREFVRASREHRISAVAGR